jgi:hypothetical protein
MGLSRTEFQRPFQDIAITAPVVLPIHSISERATTAAVFDFQWSTVDN